MKIIIIGAGPGGYETALLAAKRGVEVVLIEAGHVGGTCLNEGCIPTKTFCKNAEVLDGLKEAETFGVTDLSYGFDFKAVTARKNAVVEQLRGGVEGLLGHKLITLVRGKASFKDAHTVLVTPVDPSHHCEEQTLSGHSDEQGDVATSTEYTADYIIIATGSTSSSLPVPGADLPGILTSREILDLQEVPKSLCVIGGGVIGLEFASIFRSFGSEVTVLEYCKDILPRFDTDLAKRLKQSLGKRGINIETQAQVTGIEDVQDENGASSYKVTYIRKGKEDAMKHIVEIALDENNSITHDFIGKFGSASVLLKKAPEGTGIIAGGPARVVCELAGIKNIRTKSLGSNNKQNVVLATIAGLSQLKAPEEVAKNRGKSVEEIFA